MTAAVILEEMKRLLQSREELCRKLHKLETMRHGTGAQVMDAMPKAAAKQVSTQVVLHEISDVMDKLAAVEHDLKTFSRMLEPSMERLSAGASRVPVKMRYVDFLPIRDIAQLTAYTPRHVYRLLAEAEKEMCA